MILGRIAALARDSWLGRFKSAGDPGDLAVRATRASRLSLTPAHASRVNLNTSTAGRLILTPTASPRIAVGVVRDRRLTMETDYA